MPLGLITGKAWERHVRVSPLSAVCLDEQDNAIQNFSTELRMLHAVLRPQTSPSTSRTSLAGPTPTSEPMQSIGLRLQK